MKQLVLILCAVLFGRFGVSAQRLEHFDVLLLSLSKTTDGVWQAATPRYLADFNRKGYNNQPAFFPGNEIYLAVQMPSDTTQTDIVALNLAAQTQIQVTSTREAEYSPTPMPDGKRFSCVRVEADGAQRLWSFPIDRSDNGRPVFPNITGVGYHCWLRDTLAALFMVGENNNPHTLALAGLKGQKTMRIASNIGRCLQKLPDGRLAYVQKATDQTWFIKTYDVNKQSSEILVKTLPGSEDFAVLPDGTLLAGIGAKLFQYEPGRNQDWREVANLTRFGVLKMTRLAVSKDGKMLVLVVS